VQAETKGDLLTDRISSQLVQAGTDLIYPLLNSVVFKAPGNVTAQVLDSNG